MSHKMQSGAGSKTRADMNGREMNRAAAAAMKTDRGFAFRFWRERQTRFFCCFLLIFCFFLCSLAIVFCLVQTNAAQEMLLVHERLAASSLLAQGVPEAVIAEALSTTELSQSGAELVLQIGHSGGTPVWLLPETRGLLFSGMLYAGMAAALLCIVLLGGAVWFLQRREQSYWQAALVVDRFSEGDFSEHLPRSREGTLYQLFAAVDGLANALQAKSETELQAKEALKETVSDISHQLKTPLAALSMYNEIISEEADNAAAVRSFAQKSAVSLERMQRLIQSLLKVMRLDAGSIEFAPQLCRISEVVEHAVEELLTRAAAEQKSLTVDGAAEAEVRCDPVWTAEAVANLVKNALDHTEAGGQIRISWLQTPAMLRLNVADDGCGIAPEEQHLIFKRFYRSRHSSDAQGVGLGLALARSVIEKQNGVLSVQSAVGQGTEFSISFLTES